ncbi:MAG: NifB/NifX family molybdenum-iron cluster-binding protein [Rhodospirillales bacterium]|jgi:predicted Fe-Mo cluster-binding NifX family protein|nr:NifB/NifX family molybdenum-iron cluster-binding protein [Rhodospirillales bacterium]
MNTTVAFPCEHPGGIDARLSGHFGHCVAFTLVTLADEGVKNVEVVPAVAHEHGGCMAPVQLLADHGAQVLVAYGMGGRPLQGFAQVGIMVLQAGDASVVSEALDALREGRLARFDPGMACGGGQH